MTAADSGKRKKVPATDFGSLLKAMKEAESISVFGHINPDGDSIGAILALNIYLRNIGKTDIRLYSRDGSPGFLKFLPGSELIRVTENPETPPAELAVLVDCGGPRRAGEEMIPLIKAAKVCAVVDHHATNGGFGDIDIIDPRASSTCEILTRILEESGERMTPDLATCLYTGIMFDTGRFIHSNTTPDVFRACADLISAGANPSKIATSVYKHRSPAHLRMLGYALNNMKTAEDGAISWTVVERSVYDQLGAVDEDTEGIVEQIGAYSGCEAHIFFSQSTDGRTRVSMRSTGRVNVGKICEKFGGGGHDFAAGMRSKDPLNNIVERVITETVKALKKLKSQNQ
ncbi:MAG TPA: bifunctional oligoribonuclease/PAP phosphatase NrnA [bacterium]|nr:bifunctional oligoribonuclease/PAP phosphatase NrnA [bacterium]